MQGEGGLLCRQVEEGLIGVRGEIGRGWWRERVWISVGAGSL